MKRTVLAGLTFLLGSTLLTPADARAADPNTPQPLELKRIMSELSREMQRVAAAIAREDWPAVKSSAPRIASHRQPPAAERARIVSFVGSDIAKFRMHDKKTHEAAEALGAAAARLDGGAVIAAFQVVQRSCYGCHLEFRKPFVEHFYGRQ